MKTTSLLTLAASAALISSATATVTIDYVTVGNAGNAADTTGYGAVSYAYQIGKYEVTTPNTARSSMRPPRPTATGSITPACRATGLPAAAVAAVTPTQ